MFGILGAAISTGAADKIIDFGIDEAKNKAVDYGLKTIGINVGTKKK